MDAPGSVRDYLPAGRAWFSDSHHLHVSGGAIAGIKIVRGVQQVVGRIRKREASGVGVVQIKQQEWP